MSISNLKLKLGDMLRAHARQIRTGKWLSTVCTRSSSPTHFTVVPCIGRRGHSARVYLLPSSSDDYYYNLCQCLSCECWNCNTSSE